MTSELVNKLVIRKEYRSYNRLQRQIARQGRGVPKPIFESGMTIEPRGDVEMVAIYQDEHDNLLVAMAPRESNDRFWPGGMYALLGTAVRKKDTSPDGSLKKSFKRLFTKEFKVSNHPNPVLVDNMLMDTPRETELALVYYVRTAELIPGITYFPVDKLPENLAGHHYSIIDKAVKKYKEDHGL